MLTIHGIFSIVTMQKIKDFYNKELESVKINVSIENKAKEKIISANKLYNNILNNIN